MHDQGVAADLFWLVLFTLFMARAERERGLMVVVKLMEGLCGIRMLQGTGTQV